MSAILRPSSIPSPLRSSKPAADINGFFQIVGQAVVLAALVGEFGLQKKIVTRDQAGAVGGG